MLVLSRKCNERIDFPNLGISVEVLRVAGNTVRVGVEAPRDVRILRGELTDEKAVAELREEERKARHEFRNRLHTANLSLHLLHKQLEVGKVKEADATLELVLNSLSDLEKVARPAQPDSGSMPSGHSEPSLHALVVEDNPNERALLSGYLQLCGYEVDGVEDGQAALEYLSQPKHRPDLVLLDMQMPRMDGRQTISAVRSNPAYRDIKLFAVSGMNRKEVCVPLGKTGVDRWFDKPLKPDQFAHALETELAGI